MGSPKLKRHDTLVEYVARHVKQRFYDDVRARAEGFLPPARVDCEVAQRDILPDVTMVARGGELHVIEVETPDSLRRKETEQRWKSLARHAQARGGRLWVAVPAGTSQAAAHKLRSLELEGKVWEVQPESF